MRRLLLAPVVGALCAIPLLAQSIFTYAGGSTGDGRPATACPLSYVTGIAVSDNGDLFITELLGGRVRKVDALTGRLITIAGNGEVGFKGDGGPATSAILGSGQYGIAVDSAGNLYFGDPWNSRIRKVSSTDGGITTFAGGGSSTDAGPATSVRIMNSTRSDLFISGDSLYVSSGSRIWQVSLSTQIAVPIAGQSSWGFSGDDGPATLAQIQGGGIAVGPDNNLYLADSSNDRIRMIDMSTGIITTIAGNGKRDYTLTENAPALTSPVPFPRGIAVDSNGDVYWGVNASRIRRLDRKTKLISTFAGAACNQFTECGDDGDGGPALSAHFAGPDSLRFDRDGHLLVGTYGGSRVRRIDRTRGTVTTIAGTGVFGAGDGGPATGALLRIPTYIATDEDGNLFIPESFSYRVRRVDRATRTISSVAGTGLRSVPFQGVSNVDPLTTPISDPYSTAVCRNGDLLISTIVRPSVLRISAATGKMDTLAGPGNPGYSGDGGPATQAQISGTATIACAPNGNVVIADVENHRIREIDLVTKKIVTIAGNGALDPAGNCVRGGDDSAATATPLCFPSSLAFDSEGNLFIGERSGFVRKLSQGSLSTVAGNASGKDIDGLPAQETSFDYVTSLAFDGRDNLYVSGFYGVRKIDRTTQIVSRVVGVATPGRPEASDGGPATGGSMPAARLAVTREGTIFLSQRDRIRVVEPCTTLETVNLSSPSNGSTGVKTAAALSWAPTSGAFRYDVYLDTVSPPLKKAAEDISTRTFSTSNLEPLTTYYWKIVAKGDPYCDPFRTAESEVRSFTTANVCAAPGAFDATLPR